MPVRGAASTYCLPKDSPQNLTRYSTAGARRHCSTVSHALCRYASIIVALVCWIGVEPVLGWRKSPRCNMTTEYECKTGHCIPVDQVCLLFLCGSSQVYKRSCLSVGQSFLLPNVKTAQNRRFQRLSSFLIPLTPSHFHFPSAMQWFIVSFIQSKHSFIHSQSARRHNLALFLF